MAEGSGEEPKKKTRGKGKKKAGSNEGDIKNSTRARKKQILTPEIIEEHFTDFDKKFLIEKKKHPEVSNRQTSKKVSKTGESVAYIYRRLEKNEYLALAIEQIRSSHAEQLSRVITPKALQELENALDDEDLNRKDKLPYVKLALDKEPKFADRRDAAAPARINIEQIQVLIKQGLGSENYSIDDVIDAEIVEG